MGEVITSELLPERTGQTSKRGVADFPKNQHEVPTADLCEMVLHPSSGHQPNGGVVR